MFERHDDVGSGFLTMRRISLLVVFFALIYAGVIVWMITHTHKAI